MLDRSHRYTVDSAKTTQLHYVQSPFTPLTPVDNLQNRRSEALFRLNVLHLQMALNILHMSIVYENRGNFMSKSIARVETEHQVLSFLTEQHGSIQAIADKTGLHYYTVRRIVNDLLMEQVVKIVGTVDRHKLYAYNVDSKRTEDRIPRMTDLVNKTSHKAIYIMEAVGKEDKMKSAEAARNLPRHMTHLMVAANVASHGQDVNFRLDRIREEMQRDYLFVKSLASMYEQVLQEPRFWDPKHLRAMADDPDYKYPEVQKASDYYEREEQA